MDPIAQVLMFVVLCGGDNYRTAILAGATSAAKEQRDSTRRSRNNPRAARHSQPRISPRPAARAGRRINRFLRASRAG